MVEGPAKKGKGLRLAAVPRHESMRLHRNDRTQGGPERAPSRAVCVLSSWVAWVVGRGLGRKSWVPQLLFSSKPARSARAARRVRDPPRQQKPPSPSVPSKAGSARMTARPDQETLRSRLLATDACWCPSWRPLRRSGSNLTHAPTAHGERDTSQALTASPTGPIQHRFGTV